MKNSEGEKSEDKKPGLSQNITANNGSVIENVSQTIINQTDRPFLRKIRVELWIILLIILSTIIIATQQTASHVNNASDTAYEVLIGKREKNKYIVFYENKNGYPLINTPLIDDKGKNFDIDMIQSSSFTFFVPFYIHTPCNSNILHTLVVSEVLRQYLNKPISVLFVTLSPKEDTDLQIESFANNWNLNDSEQVIRFDKVDLEKFSTNLGWYYKIEENGTISHTTRVTFTDADKHLLGTMHFENVDVSNIIRTILYLTVDKYPNLFRRELLVLKNNNSYENQISNIVGNTSPILLDTSLPIKYLFSQSSGNDIDTQVEMVKNSLLKHLSENNIKLEI